MSINVVENSSRRQEKQKKKCCSLFINSLKFGKLSKKDDDNDDFGLYNILTSRLW